MFEICRNKRSQGKLPTLKELPDQTGSPVNFAKHFRKKNSLARAPPQDRAGNAPPGRRGRWHTEPEAAAPHAARCRLGTPQLAPNARGRSQPVPSARATRCAPLTACASPAAGGQRAVTSMPCSRCVCFSWLSDGFSWAAPTVLLVHSSTSLCRSSVKVPLLLLLLFACAWTCRVGWGPGSGPGTRLLVEDPGEAHTGPVGDTAHSAAGQLQSFAQRSCLGQATPCFRRWSAFGGPRTRCRHSGTCPQATRTGLCLAAVTHRSWAKGQDPSRWQPYSAATLCPRCPGTPDSHVRGSSENWGQNPKASAP